jgi:hypothetical protein
MQKSYKVKCIESKYDSENDMLIWKLYFPEKSAERIFAFPADDFKKARNIKHAVSEEDWNYFCKVIANKEFNFVMEEE